MNIRYYTNTTFDALKRWFIAQCYDSAIVGLMWLAGLWYLHVPWAVFWALVASGLQFIPVYGPVLSLLGPSLAMLASGASWNRYVGVLALYAVIVIVDTFLLQPYLMHRQNRVPVWASIIVPLLAGVVIPFWGVLLAPPLLAVIYAHRKPQTPPPQQQAFGHGEGVVLPPEDRNGTR